jgi:DnaJ-domain-containing protein 1
MIGKGKDYYKILGVDSQASQDAIEKAYKGKFAEMGLRPENVKNPV